MGSSSKVMTVAFLVVLASHLMAPVQNPEDVGSSRAYRDFSNLPGNQEYYAPHSPYESFSQLPQEDYYYYDNYPFYSGYSYDYGYGYPCYNYYSHQYRYHPWHNHRVYAGHRERLKQPEQMPHRGAKSGGHSGGHK